MEVPKPTKEREIVRHVDEAAERIQFLFKRFLEEFSVEQDASLLNPPQRGSTRESASDDRIYLVQMRSLRSLGSTTLYVDMAHLDAYNEVLATAIVRNYYRFEAALRKAIQLAMHDLDPSYAREAREAGSAAAGEPSLKEFWVALYGQSAPVKIRDLTTEKLGVLVSISGTVTRTSDVRPELLYGSFMCRSCGRTVRGVEQQFKYTVPQGCVNPECPNAGKAPAWQIQIEDSTFTDWQKVTLQEHSSEIPSGSMPRSLEIILRNDQVEKASAGDLCVFTGCLVVVPDVAQLRVPGASVRYMREASSQSGFPRAANAGLQGLAELGVKDLTYRLAFLGSSVQRVESRFGAASVHDGAEAEEPLFTEEEMEEILRLKADPLIYKKLANSVAPSIFGHEEIKRGILLMLFGGVHKTTPEGINIRGDINVCVVGDPSMSKSQFLKYVVNFMPRAVYTSGKASSAAGLTATVARDPESGDFNIEAGALMLANNGVCCIDEFDKMDVKDQVAIHEAMEQQTISIAKAGIKATLNARTSILAAANPISGRYDKTKTLRGNLSIGAAIMSRFDLFFIVVDESDEQVDLRIANHILSVHQRRPQATAELPVSAEQLSRYLRYARTIRPQISDAAAQLLVENYRGLRQNDVSSAGKTSYRITVRQLESMIRLSEALARVHLDPVVQPRYVQEAARLLKRSIINVETEDISFEDALQAEQTGGLQDDGDDNDDDDDDDRDTDLGDHQQTARLRDDETESEGSQTRTTLSQPTSQPTQTASSSSSSSQSTSTSQPSRRKVRLSFEEYQRISNLLVVNLRAHETKNDAGMSQQGLIQHFLQQEHITDRTQLVERTRLLNHIIQRLIDKDGVLIVTDDDEATSSLERTLRTHPDYDPYN